LFKAGYVDVANDDDVEVDGVAVGASVAIAVDAAGLLGRWGR
jgi:hypothetical protein